MRVRIYVTANGTDRGVPPVLYIDDSVGAATTPHPDGAAWKYFATVDLDDPLLVPEAERIAEALASGGTYIGTWLPV